MGYRQEGEPTAFEACGRTVDAAITWRRKFRQDGERTCGGWRGKIVMSAGRPRFSRLWLGGPAPPDPRGRSDPTGCSTAARTGCRPIVVKLFEWYASGEYSLKVLTRKAAAAGLTN